MNERLEAMSKDKLIRLIVLQVGALDQAKAEAAECRRQHLAALAKAEAGWRQAIAEARECTDLLRQLADAKREIARLLRERIALQRESRRWQ